ncbi:MAG: hypothetical protein P8P20_15365, partial [Acidimicrobiales bacterium]|nr:hypothetical protein [Acidimicrobiales bacterium]
AIDSTKIKNELGWEPTRSFDQGLRETVAWYLANQAWWGPLRDQQATDRRGLSDTQNSGVTAELSDTKDSD